MVNAELELELPAVPESVRVARTRVTEHALAHGVDVVELERVRLAVSEAVTNAVLHAFPDGGGSLRLALTCAPGVLRVCVEDRGCGRSAARRETAGAGFGLRLMQQLSDRLELRDDPGGTHVAMTVDLPGLREGDCRARGPGKPAPRTPDRT